MVEAIKPIMTPLNNKYRQVISDSLLIKNWMADRITERDVHIEKLTAPRIKGKFKSRRPACSASSAGASSCSLRYRKDTEIGRWAINWSEDPRKQTRVSRKTMISRDGNQPPSVNIVFWNLKKARGVTKLSAIMTMKPARFAAILSQYSLVRWCLWAPGVKIIELLSRKYLAEHIRFVPACYPFSFYSGISSVNYPLLYKFEPTRARGIFLPARCRIIGD